MTTCSKNCTFYCFPKTWGKRSLRTFGERLPLDIQHDCRLIRTAEGKYYLTVPIDQYISPITLLVGHVASLDPGEKIFQTCYDNKDTAYLIGGNDSQKLDRLAGIATRMREGIERVNNPNGTKTYRQTSDHRKRKKLKKIAARMERKAKNMISDLHRKTAKFLTNKYDAIMIPSFRSQRMAKRSQRNGQRRRLGRDTTRRLIRWSHYKFRALLQSKAKIAGTKVFVVEEPYTSKTCGNCFYINHGLGGNRRFVCPKCNSSFHRDVNAARNIMMHNWNSCGMHFEQI